MLLKIAARKSDLARLQAYLVGEALAKAHPELNIQYLFRESLGDKNQHDPLWKMPEKGVFTQDFHQDLVSESCDLVVHSWKDLPVELPQKTEIAATLPRADLRDVLLMVKERAEAKPKRVRIFSSSPRREYNLTPFLKEALPFEVEAIEFSPVRGNIQTRVRKLLESDQDGLIVAKAALDRLLSTRSEEFAETRRQLRLALDRCLFMVLPLSENPPAAAQGALAIEVKSSRQNIKKLLEPIHDPNTFEMVKKERSILKKYGGGCHQKIGVACLSHPYGELFFLKGLTSEGEVLNQREIHSDRQLPQANGDEAAIPRLKGRQPLDPKNLPRPKEKTGLFVSKALAYPESWPIDWNQIIWTAGVSSWIQLARRGHWVSGTSDSLGEDIPETQALLGSEFPWIRLTHDQAQEGRIPALPTYSLGSALDSEDLNQKSHFYWVSGTTFLAAMKKYPSILEGYHGVGCGKSFEVISKHIPPDRLKVFWSQDQWRQEVLRSGE